MRKSLIAVSDANRRERSSPTTAAAGVFATEVTQLLNHAQLIMQYFRQAQQLEQAIKQTTDMIKNSKILTGPDLRRRFLRT